MAVTHFHPLTNDPHPNTAFEMKTDTHTKRVLLRKLKKHAAAIGRERDALREMRDEVAELLEATEQGMEAMDLAIETFSQYA